MIDTIKIVTMINFETYTIIKQSSIIKTAYCNATGEIFYNIVNDKAIIPFYLLELEKV